MTCLFFHDGLLATDSNHALPGVRSETYISPSKVVKLHTPIPFHLGETDGWFAFDTKIPFLVPKNIDDCIHGYTVTGSTTHADKFFADWQNARHWNLKNLATRPKPNEEISKEQHAEEIVELERNVLKDALIRNQYAHHVLGLVGDDSGYSLLLIGEKAVYRYQPECVGDKAFGVREHQVSHMYGSGCEYVHENFRLYKSHVLAIYATMLMDAGTAGFVELWKLPTVTSPTLHRIGVWNPRTKEQIRELLVKNEEPPADLLSPESVRELTQQHFNAGAFLGKIPKALEKHRQMVKEDPALAEHAFRLFGNDDDPKNVEMREAFLKGWEEKGWVLRPLTREEQRIVKSKAAARKKVATRKKARVAAKQTPVRPSTARKSK